MAVTINSNGTITGIAVGGLPDGVVDADTLAADAVTAAKVADDVVNSEHLVDGGVDNAHLATGVDAAKLTTGTLPMARLSGTLPALNGSALTNLTAGKILQHKIHSASNPLEYNNNMTTTTEFWSTTFTPTASNSTVLINVHWTGYHADSSDGYWYGGLYRGASQIYVFGEAFMYSVDANARQYTSFWHLDSPATTSAVTYKMMPYYGVSYSSSHFHISRMRVVFFELAPN